MQLEGSMRVLAQSNADGRCMQCRGDQGPGGERGALMTTSTPPSMSAARSLAMHLDSPGTMCPFAPHVSLKGMWGGAETCWWR